MIQWSSPWLWLLRDIHRKHGSMYSLMCQQQTRWATEGKVYWSTSQRRGRYTGPLPNGGEGILVHFPTEGKVYWSTSQRRTIRLSKHSRWKALLQLPCRNRSPHAGCLHCAGLRSWLYSSLTPSPSCRHIQTTSSQTRPKPYSKLQLPGGLFCRGFQPTVEYQEMSKRTSLQRRVPEENSTPTMSASVKRRLSSECSQCQDHRGMTTTCCLWSSKSFWWGFAPDITDWTVICTANWSWHPHQPDPVVKKTKPQSMFYKDAPFTKLQEKMCGLSALPWRPNYTTASRSWRRRRHSSPERPWSCRLRTPRRRSNWPASVNNRWELPVFCLMGAGNQ